MKFYRSKNTAAKCRFLTRIAMVGFVNKCCAAASFACIQKDVCTVPEHVTIVTFDSLDFCCTCEFFEKEEDDENGK